MSRTAETRIGLRLRLEARREEIERAVLARLQGIGSFEEIADPSYLSSLHAALRAAFEYGLETLGYEDERDPLIPLALLSHARMAARNGIGLETVLRRYFAAYSHLSHYVVEEMDQERPLDGAELQRLLSTQSGRFDRLLAAIVDEYAREADARAASTRQQLIERLLSGELMDTSGMDYEFEGCHLGLVVSGAGAEREVRDLTTDLDCNVLLFARDESTVWAWLGSRRRLDSAKLLRTAVLRQADSGDQARPAVAFGEPGVGLVGWRLSHHQAAAALPVALRSDCRTVRYANVALVAAADRDEFLSAFLRQTYLQPLEQERDGGESTRAVLRAYLDAAHNVSSAAARLGVTRNTVTRRLRAAEETLGCSIDSCARNLDIALRMSELADQS